MDTINTAIVILFIVSFAICGLVLFVMLVLDSEMGKDE